MFQVFRKEFSSFFASPAAWLFLGGFLLVNLFIFFWGEAFFARNIADLKPLFSWMPILLIFLVAALTMRSWSEERRAGTLESLMTSPVSSLQLVLGKFFASLALVAVALLLTLSLPITVSMIGPLDWGPVMGGYVASLFLAAAYIAIGLYMSSRTDNQVVALILTVAVAGFFYLIGSKAITSLFGHDAAGVLSLLGSGSRFDSITRGVLDARDLIYYLSIVGIFLTLTVYSLEKLRWAGNPKTATHKRYGWVVALLVANFLLLNVWLNNIGTARADLTKGQIYSLSGSTKQYLQNLQEPLLIRGYFSAKSHPLLEPLTPQIKDLLQEYQVVGGDQVRVEFLDPHTDQALAEEAADKYGVRPMPFRMASRYQSGVVNSYFDLVVAYGDQYETLNFEDLIEIKAGTSMEPEVLLKNPEYAITRAVRKVSSAYRTGGNAFAGLQTPVTFQGFISANDRLPPALAGLRGELETTLNELKQDAGDKLQIEFADPDSDRNLAQQLQQDYGLGPQIASLADPRPFWFYMLLKDDTEIIQVPLPTELKKDELKESILSAVQRMSPGYLKTVALVAPQPPQQQANPYMPPPPRGKQYNNLRQILGQEMRLLDADLSNGQVPTNADLLLLLAPDKLDKKQLFAVDQFLMQGGSVIVASSPYDVSVGRGIDAKKHESGIEEWLKHHGLGIDDVMVLDSRNAALPVPVPRRLGSITLNEIQMMPYPHFPDLRGDSVNAKNPITSGLGQLTLNWVSPISVDAEKNKSRQVVELLRSSKDSWTSDSINVMPDYRSNPNGFDVKGEREPELLAVAATGRFESWFKGKETPLLEKPEKDKPASPKALAEASKQPDAAPAEPEAEKEEDKETIVSSIIERSSESARIVLIASNTFASDDAISLASQAAGNLYTAPLEMVQNAIDWSLDDEGLLSIRSRAQFARTLEPMEQSQRFFWEYLNYGLAILGVALLWLLRRFYVARKKTRYDSLLAEV